MHIEFLPSRASTSVPLSRRPGVWLLAACAALLALACFGPFIAQPPNHHDFADQRVLVGLPFAMDVLSNLPFLFAGLLGLGALAASWRQKSELARARARAHPVIRQQRGAAALFFAGLAVTALCSAWYHVAPGDAGLAIDRLGMVLAFAGLLGLAVGGRIGPREGTVLAAALLVLGPLSVMVWASSGNVTPWLVLQFGGLLLLAGLAMRPRLPAALDIRWGAIVLMYAIAKLFEMADHGVFEFFGHALSGHSLKHVVASLSAVPVILGLRRACGATGESPAR